LAADLERFLPAEVAKQLRQLNKKMLPQLEADFLEEVCRRPLFDDSNIRRLAEHRARRGVRKARGAK
jgi:hypothetical protein